MFNQIIYLDILFNVGVVSMQESRMQEISVGGAGNFEDTVETRTASELGCGLEGLSK